MSQDDELLNFIVDGLPGKQRDLVARSFYALGHGNPDSSPVQMAVMFTACTRKIAQIPAEIRGANVESRKQLAEARELERQVIQRVDISNSMVISAFRDEAARTKEALRESVIQADRTKYQAEQMAKEMKPAIAATKEIREDLTQLRDDLQKFDASFQRMEKMAGDIQSSHAINSDLFKLLTKEIRANWTTIGLGFGMVLEYALIESQAPPWSGLVFFALVAGLVQWLLRWDWRHVRTLAEKILPAAKTKPAD
jgi:hypothetical protein